MRSRLGVEEEVKEAGAIDELKSGLKMRKSLARPIVTYCSHILLLLLLRQFQVMSEEIALSTTFYIFINISILR